MAEQARFDDGVIRVVAPGSGAETDAPPDLDDATRRLLHNLTETASMHGEAEEQDYFDAARKLGVDHLTAARARSRAIELVTTGQAEGQDLYAVAMRLLRSEARTRW